MTGALRSSSKSLIAIRPLESSTNFRLFSSTPIFSGRESRLGYERQWSRHTRRPPPKFPPSTASQYYLTESTKVGESSTSPATGQDAPKRSFILDLPNVSPGLPGFETLRDRRLRAFHEKIRAERTIKREMEDAEWFADPWYRMKKTPPRGCIVTRNRLPTAFLICFKPIHQANEQDNPNPSSRDRPQAPKDHGDVELGDGDTGLEVRETTGWKSSPNDQDLHMGDGKVLNDTAAEALDDTPKRPAGRYTHPSAVLVPHNVLHPKYAPFRGGRSVYVTARRELVEEMIAHDGSHTPELLKLARKLYLPPLLPDMIQSQLERRVIQELEMLLARIRATSADPQGKIRSSHQPSTKGSSRALEAEQGIRFEDLPLTTKSADLDPSWMTAINGDRLLLHRLSSDDAQRMKDGEGYAEPDAVALLDMEGLEVSRATSEGDAELALGKEGDTGPIDFDSVTAAPYQANTASVPSAAASPTATVVAGPKSDVPLFHLRTLLPLALHDELRTLLGSILAIETIIRFRLAARTAPLFSPSDNPSEGPTTEAQGSENKLPETENKLPETKSTLLALSSWAAPKDLTGRRGDLAVPLFIALHRLRLWNGQGWTQKLVNQKGHEV